MTSVNDGAAREVQAGRLRGFEGEDDSENFSFSLPPRPARGTLTDAPAPETAALPVAAAAPPTPDPGTKGTESKIRASNVHIPVVLLEPIAALKKRTGLSNGEVIIDAIEKTYANLTDLIQPGEQAGGSLFSLRHTRIARTNDGPLTPFNYRIREEDYTTLDRLVEQLGAASRGHLITVALTAYLRT
jgi:hypothetical protein